MRPAGPCRYSTKECTITDRPATLGICPEAAKAHATPRLRDRYDSQRLRARSDIRWAALLLALLALSWQSVIVRAHVHAGAARAAPHTHGAAQTPDRSPGEPDKDCPLCQALEFAGNYLLPNPVVFQASEPAPVWFTFTLSLALALRQRSPAWRSRAPPLRIQA
ncbi:DUF2946 family protein [Sphingomonas sp. RS6]